MWLFGKPLVRLIKERKKDITMNLQDYKTNISAVSTDIKRNSTTVTSMPVHLTQVGLKIP